MFGFFIKKSFFDGWDHLAVMALVNSGFILVLLPLLGTGIGGIPGFAVLGFAGLSIFLGCWWFAFASLVTRRWSDFADFPAAEILPTLRKALVPGLQLGLMGGLIALALGIGLPFYLGRGIAGSLAAGVILWVTLGFVVALQYWLPLRLRFGGGFMKNLKKSLLIFIDNPGFSLLLFGWSILILATSALFAFLVPGIAGLALAHNDALKLRLRKYDWLDGLANEDAGRNRRERIPWEEILAEEDELVGKRTLKGMIFPWKE